MSHDYCRTLFFCRASIWSCWRYRSRICAGKMIWTVDDNRPISFVRFKTEVFGCVKISWYFWDYVFIFSLKKPKSFSLYLLLSPETVFVLQGEGQIFWGWSQNPNVVKEKSTCLSLWEFLVTSFPLSTYRLGKWFERWPVSRGQL